MDRGEENCERRGGWLDFQGRDGSANGAGGRGGQVDRGLGRSSSCQLLILWGWRSLMTERGPHGQQGEVDHTGASESSRDQMVQLHRKTEIAGTFVCASAVQNSFNQKCHRYVKMILFYPI